MRQYIATRFFTPIALLCLVTGAVGCAQDAANLKSARDQAASTVQQAQTARDQVQKRIDALPAIDPVRQALAPQIDKLDQIINKANAYLPLLDAAIRSAQSQPIDPSVQTAVSAIPYGSLALALIGVVFGVIKHVQAGNLIDQEQLAQKAFEQIVEALDAAVPTPTPEQKAKVEAVLDSDVKAKVAAARA